MSVKSFLMVGVGGQGIVLASNVLCTAAMLAGYDVKKSEIHGMAQRGGSVVSHVRIGEKVFSSVIPDGSTDYVLSFEYMEFLRYRAMYNQHTALLLNTKRILPPGVALGTETYPEELVESEKKTFAALYELDAEGIAAQASNAKAQSIVMLGKLSSCIDISEEIWMKAIEENIPVKNVELNKKAFSMGKKS